MIGIRTANARPGKKNPPGVNRRAPCRYRLGRLAWLSIRCRLPLRMPRELIAEADAWAAINDTVRSEAIRRQVELGPVSEDMSDPP
jgi:hypothetical protein